MIELPRKVIEAAARTGNRHYETCTVPEGDRCRECRSAYIAAHYAVHGAVTAFPDEFIAAIDRHRNPPPPPAIHPAQTAIPAP